MDFDFGFSVEVDVRCGPAFDGFERGFVDFGIAGVVPCSSERCALANVPKSMSASSAYF